MTLLNSVLGLIFVTSLFLNVLLFYIARRYFARAKLSEIFPSHHHQYAATNLALPMKTQKRIVLFGDSRIQEWSPLPHFDRFEFINRGIGGETTAQNKLRFEQDILELEPDMVILQVGINDLTALGVEPKLYDLITEHCQSNLQQMVDRLLANKIGVIFLTLIPPAEPELARRFIWSSKVQQAVAEINQYWLSLPMAECLYIVDAEAALKNENGQWHAGVNRDSLHFTSEGYRYLNETVVSVLHRYKP